MTTPTVTFHAVAANAAVLACDLCGCVVDGSDRGRSRHQAWHAGPPVVVDLTEQAEPQVRDLIA